MIIDLYTHGNEREEVEIRRQSIAQFYHKWKQNNPSLRKYNLSLKEYINIRFVSIKETCTHAARTYLSTLAVLQLDAILPNAILKGSKPINRGTKNQKGFNRMLIMEYFCPAIGIVRLTVGQKRSDGAKVQYCITAIEVS